MLGTGAGTGWPASTRSRRSPGATPSSVLWRMRSPASKIATRGRRTGDATGDLALIVLAVDASGDGVLRAVARVLGETVRPVDLLARTGSERVRGHRARGRSAGRDAWPRRCASPARPSTARTARREATVAWALLRATGAPPRRARVRRGSPLAAGLGAGRRPRGRGRWCRAYSYGVSFAAALSRAAARQT